MIVVLLAAGKGRRTGKVGEKKQKSSFLLEQNLSMLNKYFDKIFIIVGHRKEDIINMVAKSKKVKEKIIIIEQKELLGNANAISLTEGYIKEPFIVANGDILLKKDYFDKLLKCNPPALAVSAVNDPWNYGVVTLKNGYVSDIVEKPAKGKEGKEHSNLIISGIYYFTPYIFEAIAKTRLNEKRKEYDLTDSMLLLLKQRKIETALIEKPKHIITEKDIIKILKKCAA